MKFKQKASSWLLVVALIATSITTVSAEKISEIVGANRYDTAAKIAGNIGNYTTAILVNSDKSLADGLSASSLAGKENAPILLAKQDTIPKETLNRLENVNKIYIIGGEKAISKKAEEQLIGKEIIRIEGKDRIETSEKVAKLVGNYDEAFIVNGNKGEADAMSVAAVAARDKAPIILTNGKTSAQYKNPDVNYYAVGGEAVMSNSLISKFNAKRLSGKDRYSTNRAVVNHFYKNSNKCYYAKGNPLVDALTSSLLAKDNGVVLVSEKSDNSILKEKDIIQIGGMNFELNTNKPTPNKPETNKPNNNTNNINTEEYLAEYRKEFYKLINEHRANNCVKPLEVESGLERWAYLKSKHMGDNNYFSHFYNGQMIDEIYPNEGGSVPLSGENIFASYPRKYTAKQFAELSFEEWKKSPGHNANMLRSGFSYMGVGVYQGESGWIYATTDFAW